MKSKHKILNIAMMVHTGVQLLYAEWVLFPSSSNYGQQFSAPRLWLRVIKLALAVKGVG